MKFVRFLLLAFVSTASAQTYYEKTTIPPTIATNTVPGNATSGTAAPTQLAVGSCSTSSSALIWTTNTGFGCNTSINAATLGSATFASPGAIGGTAPSTGAFTTISASGAITSTLANGSAPLVVASSTNVANLNASSLSGATMAAPGAIGGGTPAAGTFTTLNATGTGAGNIPVDLFQWGIPAGMPPSGFFANNGVYVIGQAPSLSATASFSATSGAGVTMTMSAATLLGTAADVGRVLTILDTTYKYATITTQSSTTVATVTLTGTLSGTGPFANNTIWLSGTPTTNTSAFSVPLSIAYTSAYMYFPLHAISATTAAGVFYATCASTTVCTVYNNALASGTPTIPGSPTAFSVTGPGAFTQTSASSVALLTLAIPGNTMGAQGALVFDGFALRNSNTDSIQFNISYGGTLAGATTVASVLWYPLRRTIRNAGVTNSQLVLNTGQPIVSDIATNNNAPTYLAIDSTTSQSLLVRANLVTAATDWLFVLGGTVTATYSQ